MKNKFLILGFLLVLLAACSDLTDLNIDKKNPTVVSGESLFTSAQKNLVDQLTSTNVNFSALRFFMQWWTETTYTEEANYDITTRNAPQQHWDELFRRSLANMKEGSRVISEGITFTPEEEIVKNNKLAIIDIHMVLAYSNLVETFGNVPYSQALNIENLTPVYDDGLTVYKDLISRLNADIAALDPGQGSFTEDQDNIYQGDVSKWIKFANTLRLRMGMTLADLPGEAATAKAAIESSAAGAILDNADNATIDYLSAIPNTNPLYADQVASNRQDYIAVDTFVNKLLELHDPRIHAFFADNLDDPNTPEIEYKGAEYAQGATYASFSHVNDDMRLPNAPGTIGSAAETELLLAEAVERGYSVGGTAEEHYNNAVRNSIKEWGGTDADADAYLAQPGVAYGTAAATWQEKIGLQAWFIYYNRGNEAWTTLRRLDYPELEVPASAFSGFPVRYTYPVNEQTVNPDGYGQAAAAIGGDDVETRLFWDVK